MKRVPLTILVAFSVYLTACTKSADLPERILNIDRHDCVGNIFSDNNMRLCFDSLVSDSRCPYNATCVWQGAATVRFSFTNNSETHILQMSTITMGNDYRKDTTIAGYKIEFLDLSPYPVLSPASPSITQPRAKVKITKL